MPCWATWATGGATLWGTEALDDAEIRPILDGALEEVVRGIVAHYAAPEAWLRAHVDDLQARFANRVLADPLLRLARDPLRKLAPSDRLVGAARVAEEAGVMPANLAWGYRRGTGFRRPGGSHGRRTAKAHRSEGVESVLEAVCAIERDEPLGRAVLERYRLLHEEARWR